MNHKLFIKSAECGKNEIIREKQSNKEEKREKHIKYSCDNVCKELHMKLI